MYIFIKIKIEKKNNNFEKFKIMLTQQWYTGQLFLFVSSPIKRILICSNKCLNEENEKKKVFLTQNDYEKGEMLPLN